MPAFYPSRLFFSPRASLNQFGEPIPPQPCLDNAFVRRASAPGHLGVCMNGRGVIGCANGPEISIDGRPSPCVCFEEDTLVAVLPGGVGHSIRVVVAYGPLVCGDFVIKTRPGSRVHRWSIRLDDRLRVHSSPARR